MAQHPHMLISSGMETELNEVKIIQAMQADCADSFDKDIVNKYLPRDAKASSKAEQRFNSGDVKECLFMGRKCFETLIRLQRLRDRQKLSMAKL